MHQSESQHRCPGCRSSSSGRSSESRKIRRAKRNKQTRRKGYRAKTWASGFSLVIIVAESHGRERPSHQTDGQAKGFFFGETFISVWHVTCRGGGGDPVLSLFLLLYKLYACRLCVPSLCRRERSQKRGGAMRISPGTGSLYRKSKKNKQTRK